MAELQLSFISKEFCSPSWQPLEWQGICSREKQAAASIVRGWNTARVSQRQVPQRHTVYSYFGICCEQASLVLTYTFGLYVFIVNDPIKYLH